MRAHASLVMVAGLAFAVALLPRHAQAQSTAGAFEFSPVTAAAPRGMAKVFIPDSTVTTSFGSGVPPRVAEESHGCRVALRDPLTGVRFLLIESQRVEDVVTSENGQTVRTSKSQGNYLPVGAGDMRVPDPSARQMLRVECATNTVLGMTGPAPART